MIFSKTIFKQKLQIYSSFSAADLIRILVQAA